MDDNQGGMEPSPSSVSGRSRTSSVPPRRSRSRSTSEQQQALALVRSHSSPTNNLKNRVRNLFRASAAAHMHSVGVLGKNETLAPTGSLQTTTTTTKPSGEEDEEDSIFIQQQVVEGGSLSAAVFGIIKGTVGPAILYLPRGFRQSGYAVAIPSMLFATQMYIYNAYRLLECWKVESQRNREMAEHMKETISYLNMNEDDHTTVPDYTPVLLTYGELARRGLGPYSCLVKLGISLFQFGVVVSYCIFVPENLQECFETLTGATLPKTLFLALMLLIEIPMSWMVDIRKLTPCNVVATVLIAFGLVSVLTMALVSGLSVSEDNDESIAFVENTKTFPAFTDVWFLFVGTSFFMMEGSMTLVVPLQEAVALPKDREAFPRTNAMVTTGIVLFYIFFSVICGAGFGDDIRTALTASLEGSLATAVQLAYSVAVILTFPLQNFPALQVACTAILGRRFRPDTSSTERSLLASVIILLLGLIAVVAIDHLGNVVSILGSLFGIPLALIFPPLMHNSLVKDSTRLRRLSNYCVVAVGVFAMGAASYATIENWNNNSEGGR